MRDHHDAVPVAVDERWHDVESALGGLARRMAAEALDELMGDEELLRERLQDLGHLDGLGDELRQQALDRLIDEISRLRPVGVW